MKNTLFALACASQVMPVFATGIEPIDPFFNGNSGKQIFAKDCDFASVSYAVSVAPSRSVVNIPAGTCDWGTNRLAFGKEILLRGAGKGLTTITATASSTGSVYLIRVDCNKDRQVNRVAFSDFSLKGDKNPNFEGRGLGIIGGCVDFTVGSASFEGFTFAGVEVRGPATTQRGVIHKSDFIDNYAPSLNNLGYGVAIYGGAEWSDMSHLGTENAVFVESNTMTGNRHHIAANNGARYVFRHNVARANDDTKDHAQVDAHGAGYGSSRGTRSWEIYNNTFDTALTTGRNYAAIGLRGGDGVIFGNIYNGSIKRSVALRIEGDVCMSVADQITQAYIWDEATDTLDVPCKDHIRLGHEYFLSEKPNYKPYTFPHPLRLADTTTGRQ